MTEETVTLISSDGKQFIISEKVACQSKLIRKLLNKDLPFIESKERTFSFPIESKRLARVIEYMKYKESYENNNETCTEENIKEFEITAEEASQLLEISAYLKI